jgi:hypothetical protein
MEGSMSASTASNGSSQEAKWTVMVFMGAATFEGNAPLFEAAEADLKEMRSVGSGDGLNIFVQVHGLGTPRRSRVVKDTPVRIDDLEAVPEGQQRSADGWALMSFIRWALTAAGHNPHDPNHYSLLVLWGHAYDFAIGREKERDGTIEALDFTELSAVLETLQLEFAAPGAKLDILGFDACDVATVEIACQLERFAKYLLGSQIGIPIPGWPYDRVLDRLRNPVGRPMGPAEFGSYVVRRFCESYTSSRTVSLTLLDLNRARELSVFGRLLALSLTSAIRDPDSRDLIAYLFSQSQTAVNKPYVDVADLCFNLVRRSRDPLVVGAAKVLGDFLISPRPPLAGGSQSGSGRPFVVEHGRNAGQTARLNGISIYAPHVAPDRDFDDVWNLYDKFTFAQETEWSRLVDKL